MSKRLIGTALIAAAAFDLIVYPCNFILALLIVPIIVHFPFQRLRIGAFTVVFATLIALLGQIAHMAPIFAPLLGVCFALVFIMSLDAGRMKQRYFRGAPYGRPHA